MARSLPVTSTRSVAITVLQDILDLEELKKDTDETRRVTAIAKHILSLRDKTQFELLVKKLRNSYSAMLEKTSRLKLIATKRDRLWVLFHSFSLTEGNGMCQECSTGLGIKEDSEIFWQLVLETKFRQQVVAALKPTSALAVSGSYVCRTLTHIEQRAIHYTAGSVIRKLKNKYLKQKGEEGTTCVQILNEMASKISSREVTSTQLQASEWTSLIDRGGLYYVEDIVYYLFVALDLIVDKELTAIFKKKGKGIEKVKKDKITWVCDDEDVQFVWCMISPSVTEESVRQKLLQEIAYTWITIRGHSKAQRLKEEHKILKAQTTKRKKSLRKELAAQYQDQDISD